MFLLMRYRGYTNEYLIVGDPFASFREIKGLQKNTLMRVHIPSNESEKLLS